MEEIQTARFTESGTIIVNDKMHIPNDFDNRHRGILQEWVDGGGVIAPYIPLPFEPPPMTIEDLDIRIKKLELRAQRQP